MSAKKLKLFPLVAIAFLSVMTLLISCESGKVKSNGQINSTVSVDEFEAKLSPTVQLVDVRTPGEFSAGHLKGALNFNINDASFETKLNQLDKNKVVLVYCLSGGRSSSAADVMMDLGFKEVYNLSGGIMKWDAAGKPLELGNEVTTDEDMVMDEYKKLLQDSAYVLVDYNATWCKPCIKMLPMLEAFAEKRKDKLKLIRIDADRNKKLLKEMGIESVPVLELYKAGKRIWKHEGELDKATLIKETNL